jgi:hypothetical protein
LAYNFGGFNPLFVGPIAYEPVMKPHIMARTCSGAKPYTSWPGSKTEEGAGVFVLFY